MEGKELRLVFDTLLSAPGMSDVVKLDFKISRKLVLLMVEVIQRGIKVKGEGLPESVDQTLKDELKNYVEGCIERAELTELYHKLKQFEQ